MHDPFPIPALSLLTNAASPLSTRLNLPTLLLHIHEVFIIALSYHLVCVYVSPPLSRLLFPRVYPQLSHRTKLNWDVHVVSLVQSVFICSTAIWVMFVDEERAAMDWKERVWGYTGAGGMIQGLAAGYFLWDLQICIRFLDMFGWGLLMHAVSALVVFSLGFRPFLNFYGPTFILYELSSPFLNFHWFLDKLQMTGSRAQWYNGILLLSSFFCCRLLWGTYQSLRVYQDCWAALHLTSYASASANKPTGIPAMLEESSILNNSAGRIEMMRFHPAPENIPTWLAVTYLGSNVLLNTLNFYWFGKMIETVKSRFQPQDDDDEKKEQEEKTKKRKVDALVEGVELDDVEIKGLVGGTGFEVVDGEVRRR